MLSTSCECQASVDGKANTGQCVLVGGWCVLFSVDHSPSFFEPNDVVDHVLIKVWEHPI